MNLFKIMQGIRSLAQAGKIDYQGAIQYLNQLGVEMDGIVKQALDNVFKKGKARDPDFGDTVVKMSIDEQGIPFNPKTLQSTSEKRGVENLFEETTKVAKEPKYGKLDYDRIAKQEGVDVEEIRGKSFKEIIEYLSAVRDKADGGRVGFNTGGWADDLTGQAAAIYQSMNLGGHSDQTIQDTLRSLGYWDGDTGGGGGVENIINTQQSIIPGAGGGGDGGPTGPESYTQTWTSAGIPAAAQTLTENQLANKAYWENQPWTAEMAANKAYWEQQPDIKKGWWDKTKDFFSGLGSPKIRGQLGTRLANQPRIPLPASIAGWSMSPFNEASKNYNPNFVDQLNFLEMQDGMIGRDPNSGLLKYGPESVLAGKNVISLFGSNDYEEALQKKKDWFDARIRANKKYNKDTYDKLLKEIANTQKLEEERKVKELARIEAEKKIAQDFMTKNPNYGDPAKNINPGSGGGKGYDPQHDYSGKTTKDKHDRAADLGFSDIRLKDNVELIGQSPSNINIYKFNYLNDPTVYQGVMAHEVPWASVKHSSGYMMVDYNQIDVQFKLYDVH